MQITKVLPQQKQWQVFSVWDGAGRTGGREQSLLYILSPSCLWTTLPAICLFRPDQNSDLLYWGLPFHWHHGALRSRPTPPPPCGFLAGVKCRDGDQGHSDYVCVRNRCRTKGGGDKVASKTITLCLLSARNTGVGVRDGYVQSQTMSLKSRNNVAQLLMEPGGLRKQRGFLSVLLRLRRSLRDILFTVQDLLL